MGWGKIKKSFKKAVKSVTKPIEKAAKSATKAVTRGTQSVVRRTGLDGTFVGDTINAAARSLTLPTQLVSVAGEIVGGGSAKEVAKGLMVEGLRSTPTGEGQYRQVQKLARQSAEAAAALRKADEEAALAQAMAKKKAMVAEQESEKARPITDSYLSAGGSLGGYVDAEALKKKKKLGGGK